MAVGFGTVTFDVLAPDGALPYVVFNADENHDTYDAEVRLRTTVAAQGLRGLESRISWQPAMGALRAGVLTIEAGLGQRVLTIPLPEGGEASYDAVLVSLESTGNMLTETGWTARASWFIIGATA